ncbi:DUF5658 family protein [Thermococcus sp.]
MEVSNRTLLATFLLASLGDFATTLYGVNLGFSEANPALAKVLPDAQLFAFTYLSYTLLGIVLLLLVLRIARTFPIFKPFASLFVFLKVLPFVNNVLLLSGFTSSSIVLTTVRWLLNTA